MENPVLVLIDAHPHTASDVAGKAANRCCPEARAVDALASHAAAKR